MTKRFISDQVLLRLTGGFPDVAVAVEKFDIFPAIEQWINAKFKLKHFQETLSSGETIPEGVSIATYTGIAVTSATGCSYATFPITPISLPRNLGVFDINDGANYHFIPVQRGQIAMLGADFITDTLLGQVVYEVGNNRVKFSSDITLMGKNTVNMDLMVFDMSLYGETDTLPLPKDMEAQLVDDLYKMFAPITPEPAIDNNYPILNKQ